MGLTPVQDVVSFLDSAGQRKESLQPIPGATSSAPVFSIPTPRTPVANAQQIIIATLQTVTALTVPGTATVARLQNNTTQAIRWRDDGTNPTTSTGQRLIVGDELVYDAALGAIKLIAEANGTGTLDVAFYK